MTCPSSFMLPLGFINRPNLWPHSCKLCHSVCFSSENNSVSSGGCTVCGMRSLVNAWQINNQVPRPAFMASEEGILRNSSLRRLGIGDPLCIQEEDNDSHNCVLCLICNIPPVLEAFGTDSPDCFRWQSLEWKQPVEFEQPPKEPLQQLYRVTPAWTLLWSFQSDCFL